MEALNDNQALVIKSCPTCQVRHAIPRSMNNRALSNGSRVYCPNGHGWSYTTNKVDELRRSLKNERAMSKRDRDGFNRTIHSQDQTIAGQRESIKTKSHQAAAYKGINTKMKNRVANGVCLCCNRHFKNLARHMEGQHPNFKGDSK